MSKPIIGIVMGSDSDLAVMKQALDTLERMEIPYEVIICSAHRTPDRALEYARTARDRGLKVIVAAAGLAAHLPGVLAAATTLPVIGVPMASGALRGVDALYSIAQMPPGIPVGSVGIDGAKNAALIAAAVVSTFDAGVADKLAQFRRDQADSVNAKDEHLQSIGYKEYLETRKG